MKVNMYITSAYINTLKGLKFVAINRMVATKDDKVMAVKNIFKPGNSSDHAILNAFLLGLEELKSKCEVVVHTDVQYLHIVSTHIKVWKNNGWKKECGTSLKNKAHLTKIASTLVNKNLLDTLSVQRYSRFNDEFVEYKDEIKRRLKKVYKIG